MESEVTPSRQVSSGFSVITVSIIPTGAGSRGESALPAFPTTLATSGISSIARFWRIITSTVSLSEAWVRREGMKRKLPSSRGA